MKNSFQLKLTFSLLFLVLFTFCSDDDEIQYQLTTRVTPEGSGTVSPESALYSKGATVGIWAKPGEEYVFKNWSDDASGDENPMSIVMTDDMVITANFEKRTYALTIEIQGEGTVKEEVVQAKSSTDYPSGTMVQLTAVPGEGWEFVRWEEMPYWYEEENPTVLEISYNCNVTAVFRPKVEYNLTIEIVGQGTVKEEIVQAKSSTDYPSGTKVQLTATPAEGWKFVRWEETPIWYEEANPMVLDMTYDHNVKAIFKPMNEEKVFVPDDNFEQALIDLGLDYEIDDYVYVDYIKDVEGLRLEGKGIEDLAGIEGFENLKKLFVSENNVNKIDVSQNSLLEVLYCDKNKLETLDVSNNPNIGSVLATQNPDLRCVQISEEMMNAGPAAPWIAVDEGVDISTDCSTYYKEKTYVPDDKLEQTFIDLGLDDVLDDYVNTRNIINVEILDISGKNISNLTGLEDFLKLHNLNCSNNDISDVSVLESLSRIIFLDCSDNNITSIPPVFGFNWGNLPAWAGNLDLSNNEIRELDVSNLNFFITLDVRNNPLTCIQVNETQLTFFENSENIQTDEGVEFSLDCGN